MSIECFLYIYYIAGAMNTGVSLAIEGNYTLSWLPYLPNISAWPLLFKAELIWPLLFVLLEDIATLLCFLCANVASRRRCVHTVCTV